VGEPASREPGRDRRALPLHLVDGAARVPPRRANRGRKLHAEKSLVDTRRGRDRNRPDRRCSDLLGRARQVAARLLPRPGERLEPPPHEARHCRIHPRPRLPCLRLVPERAEEEKDDGLISYWQAIVLGLLQGFSELFPISSLGHSVIVADLLGWDIKANSNFFIIFLVGTHFATALVLLGFFWRDWVRIVKGLGRSLRDREIAEEDTDAKLGWLLVIGTIPAGILGLLLEHKLRSVFTSAQSAAFFLMLNGFLLYGAELLRRRAPVEEEGDPDERIAKRVGWFQSVGVGAAQALALIPGFSRSGATMGGGLLVGLSNVDAARFAFLLATPIIGAAAVLKLPELFGP